MQLKAVNYYLLENSRFG